MELKHCRAFVAVAEELHFGRAADRLYMAQSPLSRQIRELERNVGVQLLERTTRSVSLTDAGNAFLEEARSLLSHADRAASRARGAGRGELERLRVGHADSTGFEFLACVLRNFSRQSSVGLMVQEASSDRLVQGLRSAELDVAFVRPPIADGELESEVLFEEPLVAALPHGHRLADRDSLRIEDLADEPFVLVPQALNHVAHDRIVGLCRAAGFYPTLAEEAFPFTSVVLLVAAGRGVSLLPAFISDHLRHAGVIYRGLDDPNAVMELAVAWRRNEESPVVRKFIEAVRSCPAPALADDLLPG